MRLIYETVAINGDQLARISDIVRIQQSDIRNIHQSHRTTLEQLKTLTKTHIQGQNQVRYDLQIIRGKVDQVEMEEALQCQSLEEMKKGISDLQVGLDESAKCIEAVNSNINNTIREMSDKTERQLKQQVVEYRRLAE